MHDQALVQRARNAIPLASAGLPREWWAFSEGTSKNSLDRDFLKRYFGVNHSWLIYLISQVISDSILLLNQ